MPKKKQKAKRVDYKGIAEQVHRDLLQVAALRDAEAKRRAELEASVVSLSQQLDQALDRLRDAQERVQNAAREYESRKREDRALLLRARDLLIHEKVSAQFEGRALPTGRDPLAKPSGWRVNGIGELIDAIDQNSR